MFSFILFQIKWELWLAGWTDLSEEAMDAQNREYQERLSQKTAFLKSLAVDIESEAKDHHKNVIQLYIRVSVVLS